MHALTLSNVVADLLQVRAAPNDLAPPNKQATGQVNSWVNAAMQGDQRAAERLVAYLYPTVAKILRGRLPQHLGEEDIAQEVFVKMFAKLGQYRREVPLEHWVSRIAVTTCLNAVRGKRHRLELRRADLNEIEEALLDNRIESDSPETRSPHEQVANKELLAKLLSHLSTKDRMIIEMIELEGRTSEEAASVLGISSIALRVRASRARAKLRRHVSTLLNEPRS